VPRNLTILASLAALLAAPAIARAQDPIHWTISRPANANVAAGKEFEVALTAQIDMGWHLYSLTQPPGVAVPTVIGLQAKPAQPFSLVGDFSAPPPTRAHEVLLDADTEFYEDSVAFGARVRVSPGTASGRYKLRFEATYITCSDKLCLPQKTDVMTIEVGVGTGIAAGANETTGAAGATNAVGATPVTGTTTRAGASIPDAAPATPGTGAAAGVPAGLRVVDMAAASQQAGTLGAYLGLAALMGALSLLTPCVFPMVPITVSYFTNRAGRSRREATTQALIYGLGIVLTFTAVGLTVAIAFGASGLNRFAANPWLNLGVTALFLAFALSLFGVWEIALPSKLLTAASTADSGKGRLAGTLLMALAFTLTSFTCTAPFLGTLLVVAAQGDWQWPLAGMLAFSGVFALPFVILALVPQILASLPRSGPWLIAVKAVMGIVEIAAAMKFISNVDLVWGWNIFTRNVVLATWVALAVVLVAYLAGLVKLGPVPRLRRPGLGRGILTIAAATLAVWLATGLAGKRVGELEAFLPPADAAMLVKGGELPWPENDYDKALADARKTGQRLFIDFTGYTCVNCRLMETNMFPRPEIARELSRYARVRLYTDRPGEPYITFQKMEQTLFGTVALPLYAVMSSDGKPIVFFSGLTRNPEEFLAFLRRGLQ
jgi:thiol:disulfide interchange protein DsbD